MGARFTVGKSTNAITRREGLSTAVSPPHLGVPGNQAPSILYFPLDTFSGLFYDPASTLRIGAGRARTHAPRGYPKHDPEVPGGGERGVKKKKAKKKK